MYQNKLKKGLAYLILGFFIVFSLRLLYGYMRYPTYQSVSENLTEHRAWQSDYEPKNYASDKFKQGNQITVDQKYEKVGTITTMSSHFEDDEKKLRSSIETYQALIQFEQHIGLIGRRTLSLAIGVLPLKFDLMIEEIKKIGRLTLIQIDKMDKTNEYKELKAKRISLEKAREGLTALKGQGGRVEELIQLEEKILQIENEIQSLGVKLGEYDQENEFCTIKFTLLEAREAEITIPVAQRLKVALEWTIKFYLRLVAILCVGTLLILCIIITLQVSLNFLGKMKGLTSWIEELLKNHP